MPSTMTATAAACEAQPLDRLVAEVTALIPPVWPLPDYVAVNPFLGMSGMRFLEARRLLRAVRDCEMLAPAEFFTQRLHAGAITMDDVRTACRRCVEAYPEWYSQLDAWRIVHLLDEPAAGSDDERLYRSVAELVDRSTGSEWASHIINDITRHCAAHYDRGQAAWSSPWKGLPLYTAWLASARLSRRMDMLGMKGFRRLAAALPDDPTEAIGQLLDRLEIPHAHRKPFVLCAAMSVAGWAAFIRKLDDEAAAAGARERDLPGLIAIRLAYDVALADVHNDRGGVVSGIYPADDAPRGLFQPPPRSVLARYAMQVAAEISYERQLVGSLMRRRRSRRPAQRKTAQMVFCIDVRSEPIRRHLESLDESIETFGFAGFFTLALAYRRLGESHEVPHCPVQLRPSFHVCETLEGGDGRVQAEAVEARQRVRTWRKVFKSFQASAVSCFSFVESMGLVYALKLLTDSLSLTKPVAPADHDGLRRSRGRLVPEMHDSSGDMLPLERKIDLAHGMLRKLGLMSGFARLVVICGHEAEVVNNPYKASLDCGACGGHSGEPNARVAAALLNDAAVRRGLAERGVAIPDDTWFLVGMHNTTTDEICFRDADRIPRELQADFARVRQWSDEAGARCRIERSGRLRAAAGQDLLRRSRDWSEVRPEWGLANNAAFIIAPHRRTAGLNLGGRSFLHHYEARLDPDLKVLEVIMTAPMIVASWISLQYYASAIDNRAFGSGNKALHNVVGQFGVLQGNGGDLMTGLPWQSVHDGGQLQHEPLRLLVIIETSRQAVEQIIRRHSMVRELVTHGWLSLAVIEDDAIYRWTAEGTWQLRSGNDRVGGDIDDDDPAPCTIEVEPSPIAMSRR